MRTPTRSCLLTQILALLCAASLGLAGEPGIDCNCGQTGYYVAPAAPEQAAMTDGPTDMVGYSPNAYYMLTVAGGLLTIYSADTEAAVLTLSVQGVGAWWGFSPDDSKFLHYDGSQIGLYNLDGAHPETPLISLALNPDTQAFAGFSPHGKYLFCSSLFARMSVTVSLWDAETGQLSLQDQFTPGTIIEEDDTALSSWGFSPDENDRSLFYIWAGPAGSYWRLANLKSGMVIAQNTVPTLSLLTAAEFGFSPCGDLFGATVHQDMLPGSQDSSTSVTLYRTSDGSIPTGSSLWLARGAEIELEAQPEWQVAHIDYTLDGLLCANSAGPSCPVGTFLVDLALDPSSAVGTQPVNGTVRFNQPAAGTVTITVSNAGNASSYVLPASQPLTVSGEIQKGFTLFPQSSVTVATQVTVTASFNGSAVSALLSLSPPDTVTVRSLGLSVPSIVGGGKLVGTVTLSGTAPANGATVSLGSGGSTVISIPASLVIPVGATTGTFSILTKPVDFTYGIVITAARNSGSAHTNLIVQAPPPPTLRSFTLSPGQVVSGNYVTAMLRLSGPAPLYGSDVLIVGDNGFWQDVQVEAGADSVVMLLPTSSTPARQTETFTASLSGSADLEASVEVLPAGSLETLTLEKTTVHSCADLYAGIGGVWGRVSLDGWLAQSGEGGEPVTVHLGTDHPGLAQFKLPFAEGGNVISNIVIMPGQREASFFLKMSPVLDDTSIQITASLGGVTRSVTLAVTAVSIQAIGFDSKVVAGSSSAQGWVTVCSLTATADVLLSSSDSGLASVPPAATLVNGQAFFPINVYPVATQATVNISAYYKGVTKTGTLTITPPLAPAYVVQDLGTLGGNNSYAYAINNHGQVAGQSATLSGRNHAFVTDDTGTKMVDLGTLGGPDSAALAINDEGRAAGWAQLPGNAKQAFLTAPDGGSMTSLGTLGGNESSANGLNALGQVVGTADRSVVVGGPLPHAFRTGSQGQGMFDLGALNPVGGSEALDINVWGQVAGWSQPADGSNLRHVIFTDRNGVMKDLGTLGGPNAQANGINALGQMAGYSSTSNGNTHAFITRPNPIANPDGGNLTDVGTLGGAHSFAYHINDRGTLVGSALIANGSSRAMRSSCGTRLDNLNTLVNPASGWTLMEALGNNNAGQIVGYGSYQGHTRAFLLNPVVPASITLSSTNVIGSNAVTATVLLNKPAPVDMDVPLFFRTLIPGNPGCSFEVVGISTPPTSLHFSAGQTSAVLSIITVPVSQDNRLTFSVASEAGDFSASLDIRKPRLTSITFNTNSVTGGQDVQINATVNLDGPLPQDESLVIALYSDPTPEGFAINSDGWIYDSMTDGRVNLSPGIDISRGRQSADFSITVPSVNMPTDVNVGGYIRYAQQWSVFSDGTARFIGYSNYPSSPGETGASTVLHIHSPSIDVLRPRFSSSHRFPGGTVFEMLLALNVAAFPSDATVTLSLSSPAASLPDSAVARVPAGSSYVAFPLSLGVVLSETPVTLTASLGGNSTSYQLVILPNGPSALLLSPAEAAGGLVPVSGVVRLYNPAEPGGATVSLTSDSPLATVPSSVVVPGNAIYVSFPIQTQPVAARTVVHLSASRYDQTQTAALTLDPVGPATLSFNPPSLVGGKRPATGTVSLNAPAQTGGVLVTLTCDDPRVSIPGSVTVPEGLLSADFPVLVPSVTNTTQATISASRLDQSVSNALTILSVRAVQLTGYVSIASNDVSTVEDMDVLVKPGAIVTFAGHHYLNSLAVEGTVTHPTADTNGLNLDITDLLDIRAGGSLDVSGRGFRGGYADGNLSGNAEINSAGGSATGNAGGSYGSAGFVQAGDISNPLYGSELKPLDLGSGGASTSSFNRGGNGGGRILIETGNFMNNGTVSADGGSSFSSAGGGSGGSIHIHVRGGYVKGNGYGHAQGGWSPYAYYSGGHGRIAVTGYLSNTFTGIVGPAGTIYLQSGETPGELVVIATTLTIPKDTTKTYQRIYAVGPPSTVVNQGILALVTNHLLITNMTLVQDGVILNPDRNDNSLGLVTVGTGGLITHSRGSTRGLSLKVAGTLTVLGDGRIDVSGMGFRGGYRDGNPSGTGETRSPDGAATVVGGASGRSGGSYGSLGAPAGGGTPNLIYGLSNAPAELGSGGGADLPIHPGGNGGGRVDLEAQNVVLLGQILADGAGGSSSLSGGSGGAIWLRLHGGQFTGSGALSARGSAASGDAGSGGGGRIAITGFTNNSFSGAVSPGSGSLLALSAQPPAIIQQPVSQTVAIGDPVSFQATASGDAPLFYQWRKDGAPIAGQTNDTFALASAQTSDAGAYTVLINNLVKAIVSDSAQLTVLPPTVTLSSWELVSPARFKLLVDGTPGRRCVVETSTNLADWTPLMTNTLSATAWELNDLTVSNVPSRFYRARLLR